ncbi:hypothetical protein ES703_103891 [subsurface metagenome]
MRVSPSSGILSSAPSSVIGICVGLGAGAGVGVGVGIGLGIGAGADGAAQALDRRIPITRIDNNVRFILSSFNFVLCPQGVAALCVKGEGLMG